MKFRSQMTDVEYIMQVIKPTVMRGIPAKQRVAARVANNAFRYAIGDVPHVDNRGASRDLYRTIEKKK